RVVLLWAKAASSKFRPTIFALGIAFTFLTPALTSVAAPEPPACLPASAAAEKTAATILQKWQSQKHPLIGHVLHATQAGGATACKEPSLAKMLTDLAARAKSEIVILGEMHDNPDHHFVQSEIIAFLEEARQKARIPVVLEQFRSD